LIDAGIQTLEMNLSLVAKSSSSRLSELNDTHATRLSLAGWSDEALSHPESAREGSGLMFSVEALQAACRLDLRFQPDAAASRDDRVV
jgi:hypothetical protein